MKVKPRNKHAEWEMLNKYYGNYEMSAMFRDFNGYQSVRENSTYQEVFDELEKLNYDSKTN
jgi:hypothetical protein